MKLKNVVILIFLLLFILTIGAVNASSDNSTDLVAADDDNDVEMQSDSGQILASDENDDVVCERENETIQTKSSSSLSFEPLSDAYVGDNVTVTVLLTPSDATGDVGLSVDGDNLVSSIANGTATFMLSGLAVGSYNIVASYSGDSNYEGCEESTSFNVIKRDPTMIIECNDINLGENANISVTLPSDATGYIDIRLLDTEYNPVYNRSMEIVDGECMISIPDLSAGRYEVISWYGGDERYNECNVSITFNVIDDKSFEALQALIDGAVDSLVLTKDYSGYGQEIIITKTISIDGGGHTLDAKGLSRIFNIQADDVVLNNFNFKNGCSDEEGGAIYWGGSNGLINSSTFVNSTANDGGAIYISVNADNGLIKNVSFINNTATVSGGAIRNQWGNNWKIEHSTFINNSAYGETNIIIFGGGAIWSCNSVMDITNSTFKENNAPFGGALRGSFNIYDSEFHSNTATDGNGGAIDVAADFSFSYDLHLVFENSTFTNNTAKCGSGDLYENERAQGGAIHLYDIQRVDMLNCVCINNTADRGGAIDCYMMNVTYVDNCIFENNTALNYGGAVWMDFGTVSNCNFTNNSATLNGGAVYFNSTGNVINCIFTGNTAKYGGAIYGEALVTLSTFRYNNAVSGSAMYNCEYENCIFEGNVDPKVYRDEEFREKPTINIFAPDIHLGEDIIVNITFSPIITGNVTVGLNGQNRTVEIIEGSGVLIVSSEGFDCGECRVEVIFDGNEECLSNSNVTTFMIFKSYLNIDVSTDTDDGYVRITLPADIGGSIQFTIGDIVKYLNETGNVDVKSLPAGDYSYQIRYDGDDRYESLSLSNTTRLTKSLPAIDIIVSNIAYGDVEKIIITIPDDIGGNASFTFKNVHLSINASTQRQYGDLTIGNYNVSIQYLGDSRYYGHSLNKTFTVMPKINLSQIIVIEDYGFVYIELGNATGKVEFFIDDESYDSQRIGSGKVNYNLPTTDIPVGNHKMTFKYVGNTFKEDIFTYWDEKSQDYLPISYEITILPKETKADIESYEMTFLTATILDENDNVAYDAKGTVTFFVNGLKYAVVDVFNGIAKLDISKFKNGNYHIVWQYSGDAKYNSSSGDSVFNVNFSIAANDLTVLYSSARSYSVTVYGSNGPISGTSVTFLVNGKVLKTVKTNAKGVASVVITNAPGTYKITAKALGHSSTKTLKVTHLLTLKKVKVKKSAKKLILTASLKKVNGKYLKSKKVTFKFNGKKFKAKTNKKGVAKVTVKAKFLKKLKVGKKVKYQATYLKDTVKRTVKVKK